MDQKGKRSYNDLGLKSCNMENYAEFTGNLSEKRMLISMDDDNILTVPVHPNTAKNFHNSEQNLSMFRVPEIHPKTQEKLSSIIDSRMDLFGRNLLYNSPQLTQENFLAIEQNVNRDFSKLIDNFDDQLYEDVDQLHEANEAANQLKMDIMKMRQRLNFVESRCNSYNYVKEDLKKDLEKEKAEIGKLLATISSNFINKPLPSEPHNIFINNSDSNNRSN